MGSDRLIPTGVFPALGTISIASPLEDGFPIGGQSSQNVVTSIDYSYLRGERARKVVTRSRFRSTGKFPSWKTGRMVEFESQNELAAFRYLETNPCVQGYWEQPCVVHYVDRAIERKYYPDICIHYEDRKELWEVKAAWELGNEDLICRTRLLAPALADWGFDYRLVVGEVLMQQPQYANIQLLLRQTQICVYPRL